MSSKDGATEISASIVEEGIEMPVDLGELRDAAAILDTHDDRYPARAVRAAIAELSANRAAGVGVNVGVSAPSDPITILYTNWRDETAVRRIVPSASENALGFRSSEWHPTPQWCLLALDVDTVKYRDFALSGVKAWGTEAVEAYLVENPSGISVEREEAMTITTTLEWNRPDMVPSQSHLRVLCAIDNEAGPRVVAAFWDAGAGAFRPTGAHTSTLDGVKGWAFMPSFPVFLRDE